MDLTWSSEQLTARVIQRVAPDKYRDTLALVFVLYRGPWHLFRGPHRPGRPKGPWYCIPEYNTRHHTWKGIYMSLLHWNIAAATLEGCEW